MAIRRIQGTKQYSDTEYTDENALAALDLTKSDMLTRKMTYEYGKDQANTFSFLAMASARGFDRRITGMDGATTVNDVLYKWPIMGRMKYTVTISSYPQATNNPKAGIGGVPFEVICTDRWGIRDYGLLSPDKSIQVQIVDDPKPSGDGKWIYKLQLRTSDATSYVPAGQLAEGRAWSLLTPKVPESGSIGNEHRIMGASEMYNQVSFSRYSHKIEGNLANKIVEYEFSGEDTMNGGVERLWINEEERQFNVWARMFMNHDLYLSEFNRDTNGEIKLKYFRNDKPVPIGAGLREIVKESGTYIEYGDSLPYKLMDASVLNALHTSADFGTVNLVLHGGYGFGREFNTMFRTRALADSAFETLGGMQITASGSGLTYDGKPFKKWITDEGNSITYVHEAMFEAEGLLGQLDVENGNVHPDTGLPRSSYTGIILDYTADTSGESNIEYVTMKGQEWIAGIYEGMSPLPKGWGSTPKMKEDAVKKLATDAAEASYHVLYSTGINIKSAKRCILFEQKAA